MPQIITVQPGDTLSDLLAEIRRRQAVDGESAPVLWVPRGVPLMREMETYQALKQAALDVLVLSPEARVVGMALVFGVEAATASSPPSGAIRPAAGAGLGQGVTGASPRAPGTGIVPARPATAPLPRTEEGRNPEEAPRGTFSNVIGGGDLDPVALPEGRSQSSVPDPRTAARGTAPLVSAPPRSDTNWATAAPGGTSGQFGDGLANGMPAAKVEGAGAVARTFEVGVAEPAAAEVAEGSAISFVDWLMLPSEPDRPGATAAPPADLDLSQLPDWLRSTLPVPSPLAAEMPPGPRCPHCGEALDKEELLRMLAAGWGD